MPKIEIRSSKRTSITEGQKCYCKYMGFSKSSGYNPCEYCKDKTKTMPKKIEKKKNLLPVVKKTTKTKKVKQNPVDYYKCLLTLAQKDWKDDAGKKKKITSCCKECKVNAPKLREQRTQEISKVIIAYQQVGEGLAKLLKPLKD